MKKKEFALGVEIQYLEFTHLSKKNNALVMAVH